MLSVKLWQSVIVVLFLGFQSYALAYKFKSEEMLLDGHKAKITHAVFSPDSTKLATASYDKTIVVWSTKDGLPLFKIQNTYFNAVCFDQTGENLVTMLDNSVHLWRLDTGSYLGPGTSSQKCLKNSFSPDGNLQAQIVNSQNTYILVNSTHTGEPEFKIESQGKTFVQAAFTPKNEILAVASDGSVDLYNEKGLFIREFASKKAQVNLFSHSPNHLVIAAVAHDQILRLRRLAPENLRSDEKIRSLKPNAQNYIMKLKQFLQESSRSTQNSQAFEKYLEKSGKPENGFKDLPQDCQDYINFLWAKRALNKENLFPQ